MEKRWNDALDFLELHLDGEIDPEKLGRLAGCSAYHFQRMFSYLAEVPLRSTSAGSRMSRRPWSFSRAQRCWTLP